MRMHLDSYIDHSEQSDSDSVEILANLNNSIEEEKKDEENDSVIHIYF